MNGGEEWLRAETVKLVESGSQEGFADPLRLRFARSGRPQERRAKECKVQMTSCIVLFTIVVP